MKTVIVTGANGFIGSSLINRLVKNNIEVIAIDISFMNSNLPQCDLVKKIEIGLDDVEKLEKCIPDNEYDAFYHFAWAGVNGVAKANPIVQLKNAEMSMNCATVAKKIGCKKMLCAGTIAERATESLPNLKKTNGGMLYGVAKHATHLMLETYCKNIDLDFVWMQFSNIYGPENKTGNLVSYTIGELMKGNEATFGPALQPYDFIYIEDLIEAVMRLGENTTNKNCYYIGSGEPRILKEYLFEIGRLYGKEEFIKVGLRSDDGIKYTFEMFDTSDLVRDIGEYISKSFTDGIRYTLENY
nr:NAD(P)-dependent oxidoreductase [uncultured Dorea sp.]